MCLKYSTALINMSAVAQALVERHYYYGHYYTSSKSKGQTRDVVASTEGERVTVAVARMRLTKTGRLNNTFITF